MPPLLFVVVTRVETTTATDPVVATFSALTLDDPAAAPVVTSLLVAAEGLFAGATAELLDDEPATTEDDVGVVRERNVGDAAEADVKTMEVALVEAVDPAAARTEGEGVLLGVVVPEVEASTVDGATVALGEAAEVLAAVVGATITTLPDVEADVGNAFVDCGAGSETLVVAATSLLDGEEATRSDEVGAAAVMREEA